MSETFEEQKSRLELMVASGVRWLPGDDVAAIAAVLARLQELEAAAAGFDPAQRLPEPGVSVLALVVGGASGDFFNVAVCRNGTWLKQAEFTYREGCRVVRWWPLPGAALDGDAAKS